MRFSMDVPDFACFVRGYAAGEVRLAGETLRRSAVLLPDRVAVRDWPPRRGEEITGEHLLALAGLDVEVLVVGTGERLRFPPREALAALAARGVGVEVMDTPAACRTFNILAAEDRLVVAALLLPGT